MDLILLGTGTCSLDAARGMAAHLVTCRDARLLLDCGPGALRRLAEAGIAVQEVDRILLTHLHADHTADLPGFLFCNRNDPACPRQRPLWIQGPPGTGAFVEGIKGLFGAQLFEVNYEIITGEIDPNAGDWILIKEELRLRAFPMLHGSGPALGYLIEEQTSEGIRTLAYTGDTDLCDGLREMARDIDLLLCECSFPDEMKLPGHLTPSEIGDLAAECNASRVVLTHLYPPCDPIQAAEMIRMRFSGDVVPGEDLMRVEV